MHQADAEDVRLLARRRGAGADLRVQAGAVVRVDVGVLGVQHRALRQRVIVADDQGLGLVVLVVTLAFDSLICIAVSLS